MSYTVNYGPIAGAVLLGARAGQGQFNQQQFQNDNAFLGTLNDMQRTADTRRATDMQNALGYYDAQAHNNLANAQLQQAGAFHAADLGVQQQHLALSRQQMQGIQQYRQGMLDNRAANTGVRQQSLEDKEQQTQKVDDARNTLDPATAAMLTASNGRMAQAPAMDRNAEFIARKQELATLQQQYADLQKQKQNVATEEMNPITKAKTGRIVPRPGQEQSYNQWLASMQATQNALQQKGQDFQAFLQGVQKPVVQAAPVNPQQQQQTAAAASGGMAGNQQPGQPPVVNEQIATQFLTLAHGDKQLARELAQRAGYVIPQ